MVNEDEALFDLVLSAVGSPLYEQRTMRTGQNPAQVVDGQASIDQRDERDGLVRIGSAAELADSRSDGRFGARDARAESEDLSKSNGKGHGISFGSCRIIRHRIIASPFTRLEK